MAWLNTKTEAEQPLVVFDIGGGGVSAVLISSGQNDKRILWSAYLPLAFGVHEDFNTFARETFSLLDELGNRLTATHPGKVSSVHCLLSSPWHVAEARCLRVENLGRLGIGENTVSNLTAQAVIKHLSKHQSEGFELVLIDDVILLTKVDGKIVDNISQEKPNSIAIHHFTSSTDREITKRFSNKIKSQFQGLEPIFHSNILSTYAITREVLAKIPDFIILDVAGELTDVTIVHEHAMAGVYSFPIGKYTIARMLSEKTGQSALASYSQIKMLGEGLLSEGEINNIEDKIKDARAEWLYSLNEILENIESNSDNLPIVIVGDDTASFVIGKWSEKIDKTVSTVANHEFFADLYKNRRTETKHIPTLIANLFAQKYL
ncbi:MAG: hypothetical protein AAB821_01205 [Patescibacteria group bacterium]